MDSLADAVLVYDLEGRVVTHNGVAETLLGVDRLELDHLPENLRHEVLRALETVKRTGEPFDHDSLQGAIEFPTPIRSTWLLVTGSPVRDRVDALAGVTVSLQNVTRIRRLEGFRGDLVAAAAHELRTPLTSLHMTIHLCLEEAAGPMNDQQLDLLGAARQDCERLQTVVEDLLEMARLESGAAPLSRNRIVVQAFVAEAGARFAHSAQQRGKELEIRPGDSTLVIQADPLRLRQVLDNLIENAFLHAGDQGTIRIGFECERRMVRIRVDDDGPGVPSDQAENVFAKFYRIPGTAKQGSGLGLSIVRDIVRAHGGEVGVEICELGGASFWFSVPVDDSPLA